MAGQSSPIARLQVKVREFRCGPAYGANMPERARIARQESCLIVDDNPDHLDYCRFLLSVARI